MKKQTGLIILSLLIFHLASSQPIVVDTERFGFDPELSYSSEIPTPASFHGYELGESFTVYSEVVSYFKALADASPKVLYNEYGKTYEGRPLINLVISSEENIQNIESIRDQHLKLITGEASISENTPVFTSISYNIHGNEASTTEAAMQVAYRMAAATDSETAEVLNNSIIILYICINPDGRDRYVYWYKTTKRIGRPAVEPKDMEHFEPWPGGRTNHYWFDLNRDWIWGVHPESRGHTAEYQRWMPQIHVDYHEQGYNSNYFTMPGTTPRNKLLPDSYESWTKVFGDANVAEFDKHQINYFTRDAFDFFYPGYGSSYPSVMGAIGMLTEQGGHAAGGRIVETDDGYQLTLRQRIFDHYTTSVATIKASAANVRALLQYSIKAWDPSSSKTSTKGYFFSGDETYSKTLANVLLRNGVNLFRSTQDFTLSSAKDYRTGTTARKSLPRGTYIVPTDQPMALFINSIMERNMQIEDSVMYDMATWSGPIAYNLEGYSTTSAFSIDMEKVEGPEESEGAVENPGSQYAYVIEWDQKNAPKALSMLWAKGYNVRAAEKPFGRSNEQFGSGSLIVLKGRNLEKSESIEGDIEEIATSAGVRVVGFNTGRMERGMDLANTGNRPIKQPRIALLVDRPFSSYTAGQIYFLFDWETQLPIERIWIETLKQTALPGIRTRFGGADLNDYDVMILPSGGRGLGDIFKEEQIAELKEWVESGGVLVATESAAGFFTKERSNLTSIEMKKVKKDSSETVKYLAYKDREDYFGKKRIPGSAMNAMIDTSHPLAFGMKKNMYALKFGTDVLRPSPGLHSVGFYEKDPNRLMVAGYASPENLDHLAGGTFAGVVDMGRGKVVFLIDNTQYRMFWLGPTRLMQNAVMILPGF